ncbi:SHOCT domain-containing protein [Pyruvatibacter mobilis]|uniref:SHOCT domain-containing protein n=1 Tax=Pyruvatibacter mobilis TaxID=1712261 RepID=UPI003BA90010
MMTQLMAALSALAGTLVSLPALAQAPADRPDYWHYGWDWGWGHMIFGSLMMILFWGGIIVVVVLAVRRFGSGPSHGTPPATSRNKALDILQERFARGEIDKDEFEERKRHLSD